MYGLSYLYWPEFPIGSFFDGRKLIHAEEPPQLVDRINGRIYEIYFGAIYDGKCTVAVRDLGIPIRLRPS